MKLILSLYAGLIIPPGYADGFTYSIVSKARCERMVAAFSEPAKSLTKCLVKTDPKAAPLPPMS